MRTSIAVPLALLCMTPPCVHAQADARAPDQVVKTTIDRVMAAIRQDPGARAGDPERTYELVRQLFLPSTDFMLTTQYAVGSEERRVGKECRSRWSPYH